MKMKLKLAALLTGAVLAISALSIPAGAAATLTPDSVNKMYERIAGWDDVSLDECYIGNQGREFYTPKKLYLVNWYCYDGFRVTVREGAALTADEVLDAWKRVLTGLGCGSDAESWNIQPEISQNEDGTYLVNLDRYWHGGYVVQLADALSEIPDITRIEGFYRYSVTGRANTVDLSGFLFTSGEECEYTAEDFPELNVRSIDYRDDVNKWQLMLSRADGPDEYGYDFGEYADYYNALPVLQSKEFVQNIQALWMTTELAEPKECRMDSEDWETVFYRGDMNGDSRLNVADAVLLAQLAGEVPDAGIPAAGFINADTDGDGLITSVDIRALLLLVIEENLHT